MQPLQARLPRASRTAMSTMIVNFVEKTHTLWHWDCEARHAPPMKEISEDEARTLLECTVCGRQGFYPHGTYGRLIIKVEEQQL